MYLPYPTGRSLVGCGQCHVARPACPVEEAAQGSEVPRLKVWMRARALNLPLGVASCRLAVTVSLVGVGLGWVVQVLAPVTESLKKIKY